MTLWSGTVSVVAVACIAGTLEGQTCAGRAGVTAGRYQLSSAYTGYSTTGSGSQVHDQLGASIGFLGQAGAFGTIGVSEFNYYRDPASPSGISNTAALFSGSFGFPMLELASGSVAVCPIAAVDLQSGPSGSFTSNGTMYEVDQSARRGSVGATSGATVALSQLFSIAPFVDVRYSAIRASATISATSAATNAIVADDQHRTVSMGLIGAGAGLIINGDVTVRPSIIRNFGLGAGTSPQTAYRIDVAVGFGKSIP